LPNYDGFRKCLIKSSLADISYQNNTALNVLDNYIEQIIPLIEEKNKNNFHIIKTRYNIENLEMIIEIPEIVSWVEGMPIKKKKEKEPKPEKKKKEKEPKPEKEKKVKTIKIIPEDKLVKPKRTLKKKIGTIILEGDPTEGKGLEDFENSEEINDFGISIKKL
jgi:hypothetical protein